MVCGTNPWPERLARARASARYSAWPDLALARLVGRSDHRCIPRDTRGQMAQDRTAPLQAGLDTAYDGTATLAASSPATCNRNVLLIQGRRRANDPGRVDCLATGK